MEANGWGTLKSDPIHITRRTYNLQQNDSSVTEKSKSIQVKNMEIKAFSANDKCQQRVEPAKTN